VGNLFFSLLVGALVAGVVFVAADKLRSLIDAGSAELGPVPGGRSLAQTAFDDESQEQHAASNPYKGFGIKIAFGIPVLAALYFLVWPHDAFTDLFAAAREQAAALEEQVLGPADTGFAFGSGTAGSTPVSGGRLPYTETTTSGGGSEIIDHVVPGYAPGYLLPFRWYRWHQPTERRVPDLTNRWAGERHVGSEWRRTAPSFPTGVSRAATVVSRFPTVASRSRR
jgi:hypothetical protein